MALAPAPGDYAPDFTLQGWHDGKIGTFSLSQQRGRSLILALYPHDSSAVCSRQLCNYNAGYGALRNVNADVWGLSVGDIQSHRSFAEESGLSFPLLVDPERVVIEQYGGFGPLRVKRSTFVIDGKGRVAWKHVSNTGLGWRDTGQLADVISRLTT